MISVILNVYKRSNLLETQINAIKEQTIEIDSNNIHVWYNKSDVPQSFPKDQKIKTYACNWNTKFFGRFTIPLYLNTPYIAIFDDDTMPKSEWFKNCLETIENKDSDGILGGSGVILRKKAYYPFDKVGWNGLHVNEVRRVDLVGHAWFFRQEWAKYLWYEKPFTFNNGEDITFSYLAQKYGNINTYVPPHPVENRNIWSNDEESGWKIGNDENASWRTSNHIKTRDEICKYYIDHQWKTVNNLI